MTVVVDLLCAHGCGWEATVEHADGRLLCRECYAAAKLHPDVGGDEALFRAAVKARDMIGAGA